MYSILDSLKEYGKVIGMVTLIALLLSVITFTSKTFNTSNEIENHINIHTTEGVVTDIYTDLFFGCTVYKVKVAFEDETETFLRMKKPSFSIGDTVNRSLFVTTHYLEEWYE